MKSKQVNCLNCEKPYDEGFKFCPNCGQKTNDELTIGVLFYNTISNYFSFDARFLKSFVPLLFKPGYLAQKFIEGKRLMYLHPAQMYLFISVVFFFVFNFYARQGREELDKNMQDVLSSRAEKQTQISDTIPYDTLNISNYLKPVKNNSVTLGVNDSDLKALDSLNIKIPKRNTGKSYSFNEKEIDSIIATGASDETIYKFMGMEEDAGFFKRKLYAQILKFYKTMGLGQVFQTFIDSIPLAMFFLLPIFAFLMKLFFFKKGRYAHHLVFSFYFFSFLFTVFSIVFAVNYWLMDIPNWIDILIALSTFFYLFLAIKRFYRQKWFLSFIKSGVVTFLFLLFVLPFSFVILASVSFLFY